MRLDFRVKGVQGMIANLYGYSAAVQRGIVSEVDRYGTNTQAEARGRARVDTGKMREKIQKRITDQGRIAEVGWNEADFTSDGDAPYYLYNELGTSRMSAQPMIGPAHATHAPILLRNISALLRAEAARRSAR